MADSIHYLNTLTEYLRSAGVFHTYTERLNAILDVMSDPQQLTDILDCEHDPMEQRIRTFMASLYGIFPEERVFDLCQIMLSVNTGLDGKETLFYMDAALLEVRRYFYRHQKQLTEIMRCCEFPYEQQNEELLPLAQVIKCSYEPPLMEQAQLFPYSYGNLSLPSQLPIDPAFLEPERKTDILKYIDPDICDGLMTRGNKEFFSSYSDFFSAFFADDVLFLDTFTSIPDDIPNRGHLQNELIGYLKELCKAANIEPDSWVDATLLNTWLDKEAYERLKRGMKQYGVTESVLIEERHDIPDWENRFHASRVQFRYWKPLGGFIRMGVNSVSEYQSLSVLEGAADKENEQAASAQSDAYYQLLRQLRDVQDNSQFEDLIQGNLMLLAEMISDIKKKKIAEDSCFYLYYNRVCGSFFENGQYRLLIPPVRAGESINSLDGELLSEPEPPFEIDEIQVFCRIENTTIQSLKNTGIKVKAAYPGLIRGNEILSIPLVCIETPVSPQDKLEELAESLDSIIHELRTEKDMLGVRRYINSFIHSMRIIEQVSKSGALLDTRQKTEWLNQNHFIYNLFNYTPQEGFNNVGSVLERYEGAFNGRIQINEYKEPFYTAWDLCILRLNSLGIKELSIIPDKTRVSKRELLDGWKKENTENRDADESNRSDVVYGIIQKGIEIDGQLVQKPIVNVYA